MRSGLHVSHPVNPTATLCGQSTGRVAPSDELVTCKRCRRIQRTQTGAIAAVKSAAQVLVGVRAPADGDLVIEVRNAYGTVVSRMIRVDGAWT